MRRISGWLAAALVLIPFTLSLAQGSGTVRGRVLAMPDSTPVSGATVMLEGSRDSLRTAPSGAFELGALAPGRYTLRVAALGFAPAERMIVVTTSGWTGTVMLRRLQVLPEVSVSAAALRPTEFANTSKYDDFFRRQRLGHGTFRTREDILRLGAQDLASALQGIPGLSVTSTSDPSGQMEYRFRIARCPGQPPNLAIYIDGVRVSHSGKRSQNRGSELSGISRTRRTESSCDECARIADVLTSVNINSVQFIELYRGVGELPSDVDRDDACAAVMIWTR